MPNKKKGGSIVEDIMTRVKNGNEKDKKDIGRAEKERSGEINEIRKLKKQRRKKREREKK